MVPLPPLGQHPRRIQGDGTSKRRGTIPPWIRTKIVHEKEVLEQFDLMGWEHPINPGTRKFDEIVDDALAQGKQRLEADKDKLPPIPF
jgi:hypothetical protein